MYLRRILGRVFCGPWSEKERAFVECRRHRGQLSGESGVGDDEVYGKTRRQTGAQDSFRKGLAENDGLRSKKISRHREKTHSDRDQAGVAIRNEIGHRLRG